MKWQILLFWLLFLRGHLSRSSISHCHHLALSLASWSVTQTLCNTLSQNCPTWAVPLIYLFFFCPFWSVPVKILASLLVWTPAPPPVFLSFTLAAVILSQATWALISIHCTLFFTSFACCPFLWMVDPIKSTHWMYKITNIHT